MGRLGIPIFLLLATFVSAQTRGTVTVVGPVSGSPGAVVSVPVTLVLNSGTSIDGLSFAVKFVPNGSAPACSPTSPACQIGLTKAPAVPQPSVVASCATEQPPCADPDGVGVSWLGTLSLSGTSPIAIGTVSFTIPATATTGQSYSVLVPFGSGFPSATNGSTTYQLAGTNTTVTVGGSPAIALNSTALSFSAQQGSNPTSQSVTVSNSGSGTLTWTASVGSGAFLSVTGGSGTGTGSFTVSVNSASLAAGSYAGTITVSATGASNSPRTVNVSLTVTPVDAPQPVLGVSPGTLSFSAVQGSANPAAQVVSISNTGGGTLSWTATIASGADFLAISPSGGSAPASLSVSVNAAGRAPGSYTGSIQISASGARGSPQTVAVTLVVSAGPVLAVNASTLSFVGQTGQSINPQTVQITNTGAGTLSWTASAAVTIGAPNWLSVTPLSGTAPSALTVAVNSTGLAAGTHQGVVTVTAAGAVGSPQTINVSLTLSAANQPVLALSPRLMQFTTPSNTSPLPQTLQVQNTGSSAINFTIQTSTVSGGNWLSVTPASGTATASAPGSVLVQVNSTSLSPGNYSGTINVSSPNASNSPQALTVILAVGAPVLNRNGLVNGASFSQAAVASPGAIVSLFGTALAPGIAVATSLPLPTTLLDVRVLVNETPAPLFFVSPSQINFQMLTGITDPTFQVVVVSAGVRSLPIDVPIVAEDPGLFTISANGSGQAAVLNADNSLNGSGNPGAAGSVLQIYATGLGKVEPPIAPGQAAPADPLSLTVSRPVVRIGGTVADLVFSGLAPGFVGLYQINARIPQGLASGQQNLQVEINGRQSNVATVAIR